MPTTGCSATIQVLPGDVVSRIAAGEVIERPAAVVKELLENSLDAGSRRISIDVKDGGLTLIRVTDDGHGMSRGDLPLAFERHATSKLRSDRDLAKVVTLGFRGEALPSIASVSHVTVQSAMNGDPVGASLTLIAGAAQKVTDAVPMPGTKIEVTDLFFNQPARKKFLKSVPTEFSHISHAVQQASLAWPAVHFRLTHNGHEVLNYPSVGSDQDRILQVYRPTFLERTIELRGHIPGCSISGVMIDPVQARTARQPQDLFVNRRPVRNPTVFHAVTEGYGSFLPKGSHPTFVLFLDIDPDRIDVNVHPTKREIRFADTEPIHQLVRQTVRHALSGPERSVVMSSAPEPSAEQSEVAAPLGRDASLAVVSGRVPVADIPTIQDVQGNQLTFAREAHASYVSAAPSTVVPFGQILRRYLVVQVEQELQVIDQHTAHERVLFQRLLRCWEGKQTVSQPLLIPEPVELSAAQCSLLQKHLGNLERVGLHLEPFGQQAMVIRAVPVGVGTFDAAAFVQDLLDDLGQWERTTSLEARVQPVLATMACHSAVRAGRAMALPEIQQLVQDWVEEGLIMTCPHGRRTAFRLSADELDKLFGRVGWT